MDRLTAIMDAALREAKEAELTRPEPSAEAVEDAAEALVRADYLPYDYDAFRKLARYMADPAGRGLLLSGPAGTGKTLFVARVLGHPGFPTAATLVSLYRKHQDYSHAFWHEAFGFWDSEVGTVCIDDLGQEPVAMLFGQREEVLDRVMCEAYLAWKRDGRNRLYITTNLTPAEIDARYGRRVTDRLREACVLVEFKGASNRGRMATASNRG